jgi:hypothetical protein
MLRLLINDPQQLLDPMRFQASLLGYHSRRNAMMVAEEIERRQSGLPRLTKAQQVVYVLNEWFTILGLKRNILITNSSRVCLQKFNLLENTIIRNGFQQRWQANRLGLRDLL